MLGRIPQTISHCLLILVLLILLLLLISHSIALQPRIFVRTVRTRSPSRGCIYNCWINYGNFESSPSPGIFLKVSLTKQVKFYKYVLLANDTHELYLDSQILSYTLYNATHSWLIDRRLSWKGALWKEHYESSHNWALKSRINIISVTNFTVPHLTCLWTNDACILQSLLFSHR